MQLTMTADPFRRLLRNLLPPKASAARALVVQHLGFNSTELDTLPAVLDTVGRELGLSLSLDGVGGDVVLAEQDFVARVAPQVLHAFLEDRPLLTVGRAPEADADVARRVQLLHADLVRQLRDLTRRVPATPESDAAATTLPPASGFDSDFDSRLHAERLSEADLDPDRAELLNRLRRGLVDPSQPVLRAGYGPRAALEIDFADGMARIDELADQRLRVARDVPYLLRGEAPVDGAKRRELDLVAWDIALAAGDFRLLHSPVNWWRSALVARPDADVTRYTRLPRHLEMGRLLAEAPLSPAELRRRARVSLHDLRAFLQACLFLGLIHWIPAARGTD
ncbi:MAG: hypothetical protein U1F56_06560 [Rubrivivax sp.]